MLRSVLLKTLHDQRRALPAWVVSLALLVGIYVALWPSIRDQPSMGDFLQSMPPALRALFATSGADLSTPTGYIQVELLSFMGPLLLIIYAVTSGAAAVAVEEERRTLDLLLSNPVSRGRLVLEKAAAMVFGTLALAAVTGFALVLEGSLADMALPADRVAATMLHMGLLAVVFGAVALLIGAGTGSATASRAVPAVLAVVMYVGNGLAPLVSWLEPVRPISPFYQFSAHDPLRTGLSVTSAVVATLTVVGFVALAAAAFRRRDVAG
ncbi:ABC-2 type transport system permease protein [Saccharomonospora amisosensis]|uniref:ABC-2 type transport system permease protein n=1 Tax=Saccharomonospora amisosensis TaxID=1128677 RepID=A0A7X5URB9_9PSEU|nr:ABC transporter permease subunit [Saccharomonospora amisosensis]NIJ12457.1 ABC-2 type transport system permease protein [Saccharomonospora amisosensis]